MRKTVLFFIGIVSFVCVQAQDKSHNFEYYNAKLDSIISEYSIKIYKNTNEFNISFKNANINEKGRAKIIDKIRTIFIQDKYAALYPVGHKLLYRLQNIYPIENTVKIKQQLLELYFKYYFYPGRYDYFLKSDYANLNIKNDYTNKAKERMLELLKNIKTQNEYDIHLMYSKILPMAYVEFTWELAKKEMQKREIQNDTILKQIRDSLLSNYVITYAESTLKSEEAQPNLIQMIGFLDMKECIPTLQEKLQEVKNETNDYYKRYERVYRFSLAKLGDKEQYQYILDTFISTQSVRYFDKDFLQYFRDDKITWKYINISYSSNQNVRIMGDGKGIPATIYTMDVICPFIKNLPQELKNPYEQQNGMEKYYKWEKALYEWLMINRDNVEFDYNVKDGWFWSR